MSQETWAPGPPLQLTASRVWDSLHLLPDPSPQSISEELKDNFLLPPKSPVQGGGHKLLHVPQGEEPILGTWAGGAVKWPLAVGSDQLPGWAFRGHPGQSPVFRQQQGTSGPHHMGWGRVTAAIQ